VSNFDRVAEVVAANELKLHAALHRDAVEFSPLIPFAPGSNAWTKLLRLSIWYAVHGDRLPLPLALLATDAALLVGSHQVLLQLFHAVDACALTSAVTNSANSAIYAIESAIAPNNGLPDLLRRFQAFVLIEEFDSELWRVGHAHLADRLRHTVAVALSWCEQKEITQ